MADKTKKSGPAQAGPILEKKSEPKAPATPAPKEPPRPVDKGKVVYLKLKGLQPFHTFGALSFKVIDSQPQMKEPTVSIKE